MPRSDELRAYTTAYKEAYGCIDCGFLDGRALEFDHVQGTKLASVSELVRRGAPLADIDHEISKCEVRCCNCHRIRHAEQGGTNAHRPNKGRISKADRAVARDFAAVCEKLLSGRA